MDYNQAHTNQYRQLGLTVVKQALGQATVERLALQVADSLHRHGEQVNGYAPFEDNPGAPYGPNEMDEGGLYKYRFVAGQWLAEEAPDLLSLYDSWIPELRKITREQVISSPYIKSRVLGVLYGEPGDCQGFHRDTQPVTALLYLRSASHGGGTYAETFDQRLKMLSLQPGDLLVMQGQHVRHAAWPVKVGQKLVIPMNYYTEGNLWRPETLDQQDYWQKGSKNER